MHRFERLGDDVRDGEIAEPLLIGRDDEPGTLGRVAPRNRLFVRDRIVVPEFSFAEIRL